MIKLVDLLEQNYKVSTSYTRCRVEYKEQVYLVKLHNYGGYRNGDYWEKIKPYKWNTSVDGKGITMW